MRKILVLPVALVFFMAAACGDDSSSTSSGGGGGSDSSEAAAAPVQLPNKTNNEGTGDASSGSIEVELDDFYFGPTFIKGKPGQTVKLELKNESKSGAPHSFTSKSLNVDETLNPDDSKEISVTLPPSGATEFYCKFHQGQGMQGAFFFNEGDAVSTSGGSSGSSSTSGGYN